MIKCLKDRRMTTKTARILPILCAVVFILSMLGASSVFAQSSEAEDPLTPGAICMVRTAQDGETLNIITPVRSAGGLRDKGFTREACITAFETVDQRKAYRDWICHAASTFRRDQSSVFEERYGESPAALCGMAEIAISQWNFRSPD